MHTAPFSSSGGGLLSPSPPPRQTPWRLFMWPVMHAGKPTPRGQTNTYENITLPQTSFAGGKYTDASCMRQV